MERVRTYVPFVSTPKAKKTSIDDWGLSLNRTHELLNERVVQISKSCGGPFCEFCVDVCLLNDGQLILLIVLRSFASLHCHRSMLIVAAAARESWLAIGSSITTNYPTR